MCIRDRYFFRNCGTGRGQGYACARYVIQETTYRNMAAVYPDNSFGRNLAYFFKEKITRLGGSVSAEASYEPSKSDFQDELSLIGGVNTSILKDNRAREKRQISELMKDAGKRIAEKIAAYYMLDRESKDTAGADRLTIALLKLAADGDCVTAYSIDTEMTNQLSYSLASDKRLNVLKQSRTNKAMDDIGITAEDLDREIALNLAYRLKSDVLIWGEIMEEKSEKYYADFLPKTELDAEGNTKLSYSFQDDDYRRFNIKLYAITVSDEAVLDEINILYTKIKDPAANPLQLDAVFIPADENKTVMIRDQLKFYDLDLPVFGSSSLAGRAAYNFRENLNSVIFPVDFYPESEEDSVREFVEMYREKYAAQPNVIAANSYDLFKLMCEITNRGVNSRENFKNMLKGVRNYYGVTGQFSFDMYGDSIKDYYLSLIHI